MADKEGSGARRRSDCIPARYIFAVLNSIGLAIIYGLKVNLSVAIVAMLNETAISADAGHHNGDNSTDHEVLGETCHFGGVKNETTVSDGPFDWNERIQNMILGSYFWGYIVTQMPGGRLSEMYSAKWVFWVAVMINIVFTLLTPVASYSHWGWVLVMRVAEGLGGGVTFPATHCLLSKWSPPSERSILSSLVYAGTSLGTVISLPITGVIAGTLGWEAVFYIQGGLSLGWAIAWVFLVYDSPDRHPRCSSEEKKLIMGDAAVTQTEEAHKVPPVPWKSVFTSIPFWAIMIAHICSNFGWYMFLVELPSYMGKILLFDIEENAGLSCVPFLTMWIFSIIYSNRLDWARGKGWISTTTARKISTFLCSVIPALCLIGVCLIGCDRPGTVGLMTIGVMTYAGMFSGFLSNHIDIAPNYAGTLMAITNTVATIPGFAVPAFVGELTHGNQTLGQWRIIFYTAVGILLLEAVVYLIFGSGEEQSWNKAKTDEKRKEEGEKLTANSQV